MEDGLHYWLGQADTESLNFRTNTKVREAFEKISNEGASRYAMTRILDEWSLCTRLETKSQSDSFGAKGIRALSSKRRPSRDLCRSCRPSMRICSSKQMKWVALIAKRLQSRKTLSREVKNTRCWPASLSPHTAERRCWLFSYQPV